MPRTLSEQEYNDLVSQVLDHAPAGMDEANFNRYVGPAMEQALGVAENSPSPLIGSSMGRALSGVWKNINPVGMAQGLYSAVRHPIDTATGILSAQGEQLSKAGESFGQGRYVEAAGHGLAGALPIIGPAAAAAGERIGAGDVAGGVGEGAGLLGAMGAPKAIAAGAKRLPKLARTSPNVAEASAVKFGQQQGIPVDAATATGNRFVRGVQDLADTSPIGGGIAQRAKAAQAKELTRVGGELADRVYPAPVVAEQAGEGVRGAVQNVIHEKHATATKAYDTLRSIEERTKVDMPIKTVSPQAQARMKATLGDIPHETELSGLRRIRAELEALPYSKGKLVVEDEIGNTHYAKGQANADVYRDIQQFGGGDATGAQMVRDIDRALDTGQFSNSARAALEVARRRLSGKTGGMSRGMLPPDAGDVGVMKTQPMGLPVDLTGVKQALRPVYDRITRQLPITQQRSSPGLKAIENILNGDDFAPVSVVDADLSAIKSLARGADLPELRDVSQGIAAKAVQELDRAVREATAYGGPEASKALDTGRAATKAKYAASDVLRKVRNEPVQAYQQAVYSKDAGIEHLRSVQKLAPAEMPKLGRAFLEDMMDTATATGGFEKGRTLFGKWQNVGPQTKAILFGETTKDLDKFFLLAERLGQQSNPSGTALTLHGAGQIGLAFSHPTLGIPVLLGSGAISKILHSPRAVKFLTEGMQQSTGRSPSARMASIGNVLRAAQVAGVQAVPQAAGSQGTEESGLEERLTR